MHILRAIGARSEPLDCVLAGKQQVSQQAATLAQSDQALPDKEQEEGRKRAAVRLWAVF